LRGKIYVFPGCRAGPARQPWSRPARAVPTAQSPPGHRRSTGVEHTRGEYSGVRLGRAAPRLPELGSFHRWRQAVVPRRPRSAGCSASSGSSGWPAGASSASGPRPRRNTSMRRDPWRLSARRAAHVLSLRRGAGPAWAASAHPHRPAIPVKQNSPTIPTPGRAIYRFSRTINRPPARRLLL